MRPTFCFPESAMMARLLAPAFLLLGTTAALADGDFSKSLSVSAKPDLYVSTGSGNIHIHPGGEGRIEVRGHVHAGWGSFGDVNARIQRIIAEPPVAQSGNDVRNRRGQRPIPPSTTSPLTTTSLFPRRSRSIFAAAQGISLSITWLASLPEQLVRVRSRLTASRARGAADRLRQHRA